LGGARAGLEAHTKAVIAVDGAEDDSRCSGSTPKRISAGKTPASLEAGLEFEWSDAD
jgi:hypothetical protein